jgi:hypothetical protein
MRVAEWNRGALVAAGLVSGVVQSAAGVAMYLTGVYFAPWSMVVSVGVFLVCIVVGTRWYTTHFLGNEITYPQAVFVGMTISLCTGVVYGAYNVISIAYFYPHFLDEVVRARIAQAGSGSFAALRAQVSAASIAIPNLVRLSLFGTALSLVTAMFLKKKM